MKREIQEDQWANNLRDWEDSPTPEQWDRVPADMWAHISESLPDEKSKRVAGWWKVGVLVVAGLVIGLAVFFAVDTSSSSSLNTGSSSSSDVDVNRISVKELDGHINSDKESSPKLNLLPLGKSENVKTNSLSSGSGEIKEQVQKDFVQIQNHNIESILDVGSDAGLAEGAKIHSELGLILEQNASEQRLATGFLPISENLNELDVLSIPFENLDREARVSLLIPKLKFTAISSETPLGKKPILNNSKWSIDTYWQEGLSEVRHFSSPIILTQKVKSHSYGLQLNRKLNKRLTVHIGVQESTDIISSKARFVRIFNRNNEVQDGAKLISEFSISTDLGGGESLDDHVKIERDETTMVEDQTRLVFEVERQFSLKTYSVPIQLSASLWTYYPFQLNGLFGAKFSTTEKKIEFIGVNLRNANFRIQQFNGGLPRMIRSERSTDLTIYAGLNLAVSLSPKLKAFTQLDYQRESSKQTSLFTNTGGSQIRLGLNYSF